MPELLNALFNFVEKVQMDARVIREFRMKRSHHVPAFLNQDRRA